MPTLKTFGGPARPRGNCGCDEPTLSRRPSTSGSSLVPTNDVCGPDPATGEAPLPGNVPTSDAEYRCSLGVRLQPAVDRGRQVNHRLGLRPYRVFLVWQERGRNRDWTEKCRLELTPVRVLGLDGVDLELSEAGLQPEGGIKLREVSPSQVTEDDLRGFLGGSKWGADTIDREFFYELALHDRCVDRTVGGGTKRRRFILGSEPFYDGPNFEFRVGLVDQEIARDRRDRDQSINPDQQPAAISAPRIVP